MPTFLRRVAITRHAAGLLVALLLLGGGAGLAQEPGSVPAQEPKAAAKGVSEAPPEPASQGEAKEEEQKLPEPVPLPKNLAKEVEQARGLSSRLESVEKAVLRVQDRDGELNERLPTIDKIIADAIKAADELRPDRADIKSQIDRLGEAPKDGESEAENIASERSRLNALYAEVDGAIKSAELTVVRGRQLLARIQGLRLQIFRRGLLTRSPTVLSPSLWTDAVAALKVAGAETVAISNDWTSRVSGKFGLFIFILGAALAVGVILHIVAHRARRQMRNLPIAEHPSFSRRALIAGLDAPLRMLPKIAAAGIVYVGLHWANLLYLQVGGLADAALKAIVIASAGTAFTTSYLQPARPNWRVIDLGEPTAWHVRRLVRYGVYLFAADVFARTLINELALPLPVNIVWVSFVCLAFAFLFLRGAGTRLMQTENSDHPAIYMAGYLFRALLFAAAVAIVLLVLTGYVAFAHYIATRLVIVGTAVFLLVILYLASKAIAAAPELGLRQHAGDEPTKPIEFRLRIARGLSFFLDIILFVIAVPVLLLSLGVASNEIITLLNRALYGFEVAGFEVSLLKIVLAVCLFAIIALLTRLIQRWLGGTLLHPRRMEQGLGNSIRTGIGYLGFAVAVLAGLSYAGLDITNLAIVAGALSVGIGFGLQSIVNNFVSGLILLVERPIKVGDWIKVANTQGYVRKISVRSTEIETFERASVIIPNSELISGTVTNMTLRNALGRITIPVGVSYDSDVDLVHKLLLEAANECALVARHPAPFVVFEGFGDSALDFSLRIYVPDVNSSLSTQTEVRKAIVSKFRQSGVEIPFPQQDMHFRDLDGLKAALGRVLEERRQAAAKDFTGGGSKPERDDSS
jgi:potassium-dependent mechanosensitive channel